MRLQVSSALLGAVLLTGCTSMASARLSHYSEVPQGCVVADTFTIFAASERDAVRDLRGRSFQALTTSVVDKYLADIDVAATGFLISNEVYQKHDSVLQEQRKFEEENPGVIVDWIPKGYRIPEGMKLFHGVFVNCPNRAPLITGSSNRRFPPGAATVLQPLNMAGRRPQRVPMP
jgi:hypothetical protein